MSPLERALPGDALRGQSQRIADITSNQKAGHDPATGGDHSGSDFSWLADMQASGLDTSARIAREITANWITRNGRWQPRTWHMPVLADRLYNWVCASSFLLAGADASFRHQFTKALARQARHLFIAVRLGVPLPQGFAVQQALICCALAMPDPGSRLKNGTTRLHQAIGDEVLADGGHVSRNPSVQFQALRHLIETRTILRNHPSGAPVWLQAAIDKMTPMLRTFVLGNGQLAAFNGAGHFDAKTIELLLKISEAGGRAVTNSPHSGYQRLASRAAIVLMDAGAPANGGRCSLENAGTLAFEMSVGKQRLIVNCGLPADGNPALMTALRGTAAHSTLCIGEMNSSEINSTGFLGPRRAWRTQAVRREIDKNTLVEATHDGYRLPFGLTHKRTLYLAAEGTELRGEDVITGTAEQPAVIRFHLHPSVQASLIEAGNSVLLKFGKIAGWRFRTSVADLTLQPSLFYDGATRRQSQQIVINFRHHGPVSVIKWRLSKED
ncbi:MAG: heparinase II/III family protein [Rhodospirillales bacterium]|nr:heparinase II/III family protein [Rhodospirillales bacterium]